MKLDQCGLKRGGNLENNFESVLEEKRMKLINCGYSEFAVHGVARSSLNKILKTSGVSKGFFYHYFEDKEDFLNYLVTFAITQILDKMNNNKLLEDPDYIRRLQKSAIYKTEIVVLYPKIMEFITKLYTENEAERLMKLSEALSGDFANRVLSENIDYSLFKDDIPLEAAMKIVNKYIAQLQTEMLAMFPKVPFAEISKYYESELEDLKTLVYKKGE